MEVSLLNVRITFQKNAVAVDGIGNHKNTWADYYSCHATVSGEAGKQTSETDVAGTIADESDISFTVRYCKKASVIDSTGYRVVFGGELYDILAIDHMNYKKEKYQIQVQESEAVTMANGVSIDRMAEEIMKGLTEYADLATEDVKKAVKKAGTAVRKDIEANAPKDTGKYAKSWAVKTTKETSNSLEVTVHSKNRYQLSHLLEHGHAKRGGGRVPAKPHIAAAEQAGIEQLEKEIQKALEG